MGVQCEGCAALLPKFILFLMIERESSGDRRPATIDVVLPRDVKVQQPIHRLNRPETVISPAHFLLVKFAVCSCFSSRRSRSSAIIVDICNTSSLKLPVAI